MKRTRINLSLYIIIPFIFAGLVVLSAIVALRVVEHAADSFWPVLLWVALVAGAAFFCGLLIVRLLLSPVEKFVKDTSQLAIFSHAQDEGAGKSSRDELQQFKQVFDQITTVLSKADARLFFPEISGESSAIRGVLSHIMKVAPTDSTVLIVGESGTGKEVVAASIFNNSNRKDKPFVRMNCVAIPDGLWESELFGHEKGSFTGATARKIGKFEKADKGTLFLDEIGDMPLNVQGKMLRFLQEREFERVGGTASIKVDVRFIAATNKNLEAMVEQGLFRQDLYYRLNVFTLVLPPLRERREDIPSLVDSFLSKAPRPVSLSSEALHILMAYDWPGNIRDLKNTIERAMVLAEGSTIEPTHLPATITGSIQTMTSLAPQDAHSIDEQLQRIEKDLIIDALLKSNGIQAKAARMLGIKERSLWHRIKKFNIDVNEIKETIS